MNNYFVTRALQYLTGLTKFMQLTSSPIPLTTETWTTIYQSTDTDSFMKFSAFSISLVSGNLSSPVMRILAAPKTETLDQAQDSIHKVFPFDEDIAVQLGRNYNLKEELNIPTDHKFQIQVKATVPSAASVQLDYLSVVSTNVVDLA